MPGSFRERYGPDDRDGYSCDLVRRKDTRFRCRRQTPTGQAVRHASKTCRLALVVMGWTLIRAIKDGGLWLIKAPDRAERVCAGVLSAP